MIAQAKLSGEVQEGQSKPDTEVETLIALFVNALVQEQKPSQTVVTAETAATEKLVVGGQN